MSSMFFCSAVCKSAFASDVASGTIVNTEAMKHIGNKVCACCFYDLSQKNVFVKPAMKTPLRK